MTVDASLQIRKLPPSHISQLSIILEFAEQWKKLMAVIPSKLEKENFQCFINCGNPAKYNADHTRLIETASLKYKKTGTEILLDEWGCSGKVRPSVGHLLHLLLKAELYRAADYVSERILMRTAIKRPALGPAAQISVNLSGNIEDYLNNMNISSTLINELQVNSFNNNIDYDKTSSIPQIVVTPDADVVVQSPHFQEKNSFNNNVAVKPSNSDVSQEEIISDLSHTLLSDTLSSPLGNESSEHMCSEQYIPRISALLMNASNLSMSSDHNTKSMDDASSENTLELNNTGQSFIPNLSGFNQYGENSNSFTDNHSYLIPNLSILNQSDNQGSLCEDCDLLPNLSGLNLSADLEVKNGSVMIPKVSGLNQVDLSTENSIASSNLSSVNTTEIDTICKKHQISRSKDSSFSVDLPDISELIQMSSTESHDSSSSKLQESAKLVHVSSIHHSKIENSNSKVDYETDNSLPNLNMLMTDSSRLTINTFDSSKSRKCNSPLPNLTLTTHLPHYTYEKLKGSTNDFNEDAFDGFKKIGRLLGSGAFGKVFLATGVLQEPVAVKKILLGNVEVVDVDDRVTKQFINEVEVLSQFRHKNLVSLVGFSCDGCTYCLLYEFIPGGTLKDRLQRKDGKLTLQDRLSISLGTANAITYLHTAFSSPLIHRDVKTANILLDHSNRPKLGDFGITTLLDNQSMNTSTVIGTSAYMAPEAMRGDISVKCDTFSFGVVLLELLTSLTPFDDNRDGHDLITHVQEKCEDSITPLLDTSIGSWSINDVNFGDELFSIACQCIEEKKKRPLMVDVTEMLMIIVSKM